MRNLYCSVLMYLLRTYALLFELCWNHRAEMHQTTSESIWQIIQRGWNHWQARLYSLHRSMNGISHALSWLPVLSLKVPSNPLLTLEEIEFHCIFWFFLSISWGIIWHHARSSYSLMTYLTRSRSWSWMQVVRVARLSQGLPWSCF